MNMRPIETMGVDQVVELLQLQQFGPVTFLPACLFGVDSEQARLQRNMFLTRAMALRNGLRLCPPQKS